VVMGPHTFNFADAAEQALEAGAALRVADLREGVTCAGALAADGARRLEIAHACGLFAQQHQGAADRLADAVCKQAMLA